MNVLQWTWHAKEEAAYEFLYVIDEMFPDKMHELYTIADRFKAERNEDLDEDDPANVEAWERYQQRVEDWTELHRISSDLINVAACRFLLDIPMDTFGSVRAYVDDEETFVFPPDPSSLLVDPHREERGHFLERAGEYYDEVAKFHQQHTGEKLGPVKRDLTHFRYLAASHVGGLKLDQLAEGWPEWDLPKTTKSSVAEGARQVAILLGLERKRGRPTRS